MFASNVDSNQFVVEESMHWETMTHRLHLKNLVTAWLLADNFTASELQQLWSETVKELDRANFLPDRPSHPMTRDD